MTTNTIKTPVFRLATGVVLPLLLAVSVSAQEDKKKETDSKPAHNSRPSDRPVRRGAPGEGVQRQSRPADAQPETPRQGARQPVQESRQPRQPMQNSRPDSGQPNRVGPAQPTRPDQPTQQGGFGGSRPGNRPQDSRPRVVETRGGDTVWRDAAGRVSEVRMRSGTVVYHAPSGIRRVEAERPGGRIVVAGAPGHGYVQRQVVIDNRTIVKRTYVAGGATYARFYRPVPYRGFVLNVYTPVRYYRPAFYAYAYNPWQRPVIYDWGWARDPWYSYYGGYFRPYPVYASPTLWLTDYLIAGTLQAAYQERMAANGDRQDLYGPGGGAGGQAALTPEVKQMIADEVRWQLEEERADGQRVDANFSADAGNGPPPMFDDNVSHVFVANFSLTVNSNDGECTIGEGDVLRMSGPPPPNAATAEVIVLASRGSNCRQGVMAAVQLQDLQEMQNHMRETIDKGLGDLQARQGQSGLPALPPGASGTIDTPFAAGAQPDSNAGGELTAVRQEAERGEQAVIGQTQDAGAAGPITLSLGQTIEEVKAIQGEPQKIVNLGPKKIYVYKDIKITFMDGKVTDVQ